MRNAGGAGVRWSALPVKYWPQSIRHNFNIFNIQWERSETKNVKKQTLAPLNFWVPTKSKNETETMGRKKKQIYTKDKVHVRKIPYSSTFPPRWTSSVVPHLRFGKVEDLLGIPAQDAVSDWVVFSVCGLWEEKEKPVSSKSWSQFRAEGNEIWESERQRYGSGVKVSVLYARRWNMRKNGGGEKLF